MTLVVSALYDYITHQIYGPLLKGNANIWLYKTSFIEICKE